MIIILDDERIYFDNFKMTFERNRFFDSTENEKQKNFDSTKN